MSKHEEALRWLQTAYEEPLSDKNASEILNTRLRRSLRQHAAAVRLHYAQDKVGNIYITRSGREPDIASIALAFPLDGALDSLAFAGAFRLFSHLANDDLICPLVLVGWTSAGKKILGRDIWHSSASHNVWQTPVTQKTTADLSLLELEQFSTLPEASDFPLSAIFEVVKTKAETLKLSGSLILVEKARKRAGEDVETEYSQPKVTRAPEIRIEGKTAEKVARATICDYSEYVAALFDNFD